MYYSVDAIDDALARLVDDDETNLYVHTCSLPEGTVETDVLEWKGGTWRTAPEETARRKKLADDLLRQVLGI